MQSRARKNHDNYPTQWSKWFPHCFLCLCHKQWAAEPAFLRGQTNKPIPSCSLLKTQEHGRWDLEHGLWPLSSCVLTALPDLSPSPSVRGVTWLHGLVLAMLLSLLHVKKCFVKICLEILTITIITKEKIEIQILGQHNFSKCYLQSCSGINKQVHFTKGIEILFQLQLELWTKIKRLTSQSYCTVYKLRKWRM